PRVKPAVVPVRERGLDRVVADGRNVDDVDVALALLQRLLSRAMAAHFGRRGIDAQELEGENEASVADGGELEALRAAMQGDVGGDRRVFVESGHDISPAQRATTVPESPHRRSAPEAGEWPLDPSATR